LSADAVEPDDVDRHIARLKARRKGRMGSVISVGVMLFIATMAASAVVAVFPGLLHLTRPVVCEDTDTDSVVVVSISHPEPGTTQWTADMFCIDEAGKPRPASYFMAAAAIFVYTFLALIPVFLLGAFVRRVGARNAALTLAMGLLLTGCEAGTITPEQFQARYGESPFSVINRQDQPHEVLMLNVGEIRNLLGALKELRGEMPVNLEHLEVHHSHATAWMEKPGSRTTLFRYDFRRGKLSIPSDDKYRRSVPLVDALFTPSELPLDKLPMLWKDAARRLDSPDDSVSHMAVEKMLRNNGLQLVLQIHVTRPDGTTGYVEYDHNGVFLEPVGAGR